MALLRIKMMKYKIPDLENVFFEIYAPEKYFKTSMTREWNTFRVTDVVEIIREKFNNFR